MYTNCPHCKSPLSKSRNNNLRCSGDNLSNLQAEFDRTIGLETTNPITASKWMNQLSESDVSLDTFYLDFFLLYRKRKVEDNSATLNCDWMPLIELEEFPLPNTQTIMADPIEKRLAEHMLSRPLNASEVYGDSPIPVIGRSGIEWRAITHLEFPRDFTTDDACEDDDTESPITFDYKALKGIFKNRGNSQGGLRHAC